VTRRAIAVGVAMAVIASACAQSAADPPPLVTSTLGPASAAESSSAPSQPNPSSADPSSSGPGLPGVEITQVDCPGELARGDGIGLACGVVTVPIDRADGSLGATSITVATLAGYDQGFETPVAVLQGGPGGASSDLGAWFPQQPFTQVFVDQRGTGFEGPEFDCPEIADALGRIFSAGSGEAEVLADDAYDSCARRLADDPVLENTDSEAHAADVVDAMTALGYRRWVAYGVSYGTTIGLELLRDEPVGLAGVVLDGVYPPELDTDSGLEFSATRALDVIDAACAAESTCRGYLADGSVRTTLERVMAELNADPMVVPLGGNEVGYTESLDVVLDGRRVAEFAFATMYHESLIRYLPAVLGGLDDRDPSSARWLARNGARLVISGQAANDEGTYFAVQCRDRLPFTDGLGDDPAPFAAAVSPLSLDEVCAEWDREPAPAEAGSPVFSAIPTLLLSGEFDPITPAVYAEQVAGRLDDATVVEQDGRGHGIWYGDECIAELVQLFVADPLRELDTGCANSGPAIEWARP
jgi:pimeloyl-ACP methyl ester carboxylesterase